MIMAELYSTGITGSVIINSIVTIMSIFSITYFAIINIINIINSIHTIMGSQSTSPMIDGSE